MYQATLKTALEGFYKDSKREIELLPSDFLKGLTTFCEISKSELKDASKKVGTLSGEELFEYLIQLYKTYIMHNEIDDVDARMIYAFTVSKLKQKHYDKYYSMIKDATFE